MYINFFLSTHKIASFRHKRTSLESNRLNWLLHNKSSGVRCFVIVNRRRLRPLAFSQPRAININRVIHPLYTPVHSTPQSTSNSLEYDYNFL